MHPMALLGDEAQVEACLGPISASANLNAVQVHDLRRTYHKSQKSFWTHPMELLVDVGHVESCYGPFGDSVIIGAR
jgi:hypothetical protein